jgi:uncharacterized protein (DUF697 family)
MFKKVLDKARALFRRPNREAELSQALERLRQHTPVPVFWLLGKTQSGKTSLIKYLTGADRAEIGRGFRPCTRFSSRYEFPTPDLPLLTFLDTRGLGEPGYDPAEDLRELDDAAHVVLVTVKALDHAQESVVGPLRAVRAAQPWRPVVLVLTCLHEAYPQQQHPLPYPFQSDAEPAPGAGGAPPALPPDLLRSIAEQKRRFAGLVDRVVAVDLTPVEEGFHEPNYGGPRLREVLLEVLPAALAQALRTLDLARTELRDLFARQALPSILAYSGLATTAGAVPLPLVDLFVVSGIQTRLVYELARLYGQPMTRQRLAELASSLGLGMLTRQATNSLIKWVPGLGSVLGSVAGGALAGASTFALGKACCYYYRAVHEGHVPNPDDLRRYYQEQLAVAERALLRGQGPVSGP